jgi:DNA-binding transcriptional ArsR family regulator
LAHPTRQRIIRLCLDEALTNQQVAEALDLEPATTLRHVRILLNEGFLEAGEVRSGRRGALERPYRATGLQRQLRLDDADPELVRSKDVAALRAHAVELLGAPEGGTRDFARGTMRLSAASRAELTRRIDELLGEFAARKDADGEPLAFIWSLVARAPRRRRGPEGR